MSARPWNSPLWRKQAAVMATLALLAIAGFGGAEMAASFADAREQASRLQLAQAREAAGAARAAVLYVQRHVAAVSALPWGLDPALNLATRREEYARLLRLVPAAQSIGFHDAQGRELLQVSRREPDSWVSPQQAAASASVGSAHTESQSDLDPVLSLDLKEPEPLAGGRTVVRIGLRALARELREALSLPGSQVYAVDADGVVVLHADPSVMLERRRRPIGADAVVSDENALAAAAQPAIGLQGDDVLRTVVPLREVGWRVVVEQPQATVMAPVRATLQRTAWFALLGIVFALGAAAYLAGRVTRPVRQLHLGASALAGGQLDTAITLKSGDELEDLARQFNQMAENLKASYSGLEAKVAEKTRDLQLANQHKSDFLAHMSHELRTPLNAVIGFADVLREGMAGPVTDEQREFIADIHASGVHLLALINDVLDLSRIEAGQLSLEPAAFAVRDTIDQAVALVRQRSVQKRVALQLDIAPDVDVWTADVRRVKQVLVNLLANAVKFTPAGGTIVLRAGVSAAEGLWVEVQDNGIGIAPADHEAVFQEFRQVGSDSASRAEGSGLGLALVRRLVRQHGGDVQLRSELGAGACFRFTLPPARA